MNNWAAFCYFFPIFGLSDDKRNISILQIYKSLIMLYQKVIVLFFDCIDLVFVQKVTLIGGWHT